MNAAYQGLKREPQIACKLKSDLTGGRPITAAVIRQLAKHCHGPCEMKIGKTADMPDATPAISNVSSYTRVRLRVIPIAILSLIGVWAFVDSGITIIPIISSWYILAELWREGELAVPGMGLLACALGILLLVSVVSAVISWSSGKWRRASVFTLTVAACLAWNIFRTGILSYVVLQSVALDGNVPLLLEMPGGQIWIPPDKYRNPWVEEMHQKATQYGHR